MPHLPQASPSAAVLNLLLRASAIDPPVRLVILRREDYTGERLRELHAMANLLMAEDFDHFRVHAEANDLVHVFHRVDTGEVVGFQFWRTAPMRGQSSRAILGGKLRIQPEFRGRALHLISGLLFYLQNLISNPTTRYYRLSIASVFGFVSITEALARYHLFDPQDRSREGAAAVRDAFVALAKESHFRLDEQTGLFHVGILMTPDTLARYSPAYFERPAARIYASANPAFRTNGCYLGFWFRFTPENLGSMTRALWRKLRPRGSRAL